MIRRHTIFIVTLALSAVVVISAGKLLRADSVQGGDDGIRSRGLSFSHKLHMTEGGIADCATCHTEVAKSTFSSDYSMPSHEVCATCHEQQVNDTELTQCGFCHNNPADIQPTPPPPPREIIFSHAQHAGMEGVECTTCHQGLDRVEKASAANLPSMTTCNTCHNDVKATNTCESCHTNFVTLLPVDHQRSDFSRNHRDLTRVGALTTECQTCHTERFCQQCHMSPELKSYSFGKGQDLTTEPSHKTSTKDSPKQTLLQNVHELNYRFIHGLDAKTKMSDCQSCHSVQTFCVQCHETGGNVTQLKFKPSSHSFPGFVMLGAGSGGGLHAEDARRDMESCASCHDVEGKDPSCMTCHLENGKVR